MSKIFRIILPIIVIVLAGYVFISENDKVMPYVMFLMGALLLIAGIIEYNQKNGRKIMGIFSVIVSISIFYASTHILLFS